MKNLIYALTCFMMFGFLFSCSTKTTNLDDMEVVTETNAPSLSVTIPVSSLPQVILDYVAANYPASTITEAEEETDSSGNITYEVQLDTGEEILFAPDGTVLAIGDDNDDDGDGNNNDNDDDGTTNDDDDGDNGTQIDISDLPASVIEYINFNHPGTVIVFAETEDGGYEVYLDNGIELHFDADGNFVSEGSDNDDDGLDNDDDGTGTSDDDDSGNGTSDDDDSGNGTDDDDGDGVDDDGIAGNDNDDDGTGTSDDDDSGNGTDDDDGDGVDDDGIAGNDNDDDGTGTSDDDDSGNGTSDDDDN